MNPPLYLEYAAPLLARGVAAKLDKAKFASNALVLNPHQGLTLDETDHRCLLALSGTRVLVIVRVEPTRPRYGERFIELHYDGLLSGEHDARLTNTFSAAVDVDTPGSPTELDLLELLRMSAGLGNNLSDLLRDAAVFQSESVDCLDLLADRLYRGGPDSPAELYYLLVRIAQQQARIFHRLNAKLNSASIDLPELGQTVRTARLVESASALRDAVRVRWGTPSMAGGVGGQVAPTLLFVDDNLPPDMRTMLRLAARVLWRGARLLLWNPTAPAFGLRDMVRLGPAGSMTEVKDHKIRIEDFSNTSNFMIMALDEALAESTHLIVDQFFEGRGDGRGLRGPDVIRFLGRVVPAVERRGHSYRPRIVAFSRNQEPELLSAALRAGADGYVLKSAPARLTEYILSQTPDQDPTIGVSRNFECLAHIPPRIRDLTKTVEIPRIRPELWYQARDETADAARLLRAIPKAELHVHVGSCMSRDYLVAASIIGLASQTTKRTLVMDLSKLLFAATEPGRSVELDCGRLPGLGSDKLPLKGGLDWISSLAHEARRAIGKTLIEKVKARDRERSEAQRELRSFLRSELRIPDWISGPDAVKTLDVTSSLAIVLALLRSMHSWSCDGTTEALNFSDVRSKEFEAVFLRTYLIVLAHRSNAKITIGGSPFTLGEPRAEALLATLHDIFFESHGALSVSNYRDSGWRTPDTVESRLALQCLTVTLNWDESKPCGEDDPIGYTLATGVGCKNLVDYLEGCEYSGSLHLKHPYLIHLYAEQVLVDMVKEGTVYRELRGSPDGYVNTDTGFTFGDACSCLVNAFAEGQEKCVAMIGSEKESPKPLWFPELVFGPRWSLEHIRKAFRADSPLDRRLPPKVGILLVGKRHKSNREMILEAAAGAVLYQDTLRDPAESESPLVGTLRKSGIVGFDLAGQESDYPPALFAAEFERLGKLHIPLTVHAGENASSQFVEDAVLILGAKRIGHALSLADDRHLMNRLREDRICVELCPVSNHQTCHFSAPENPFGRKYPLEAYLEAGIPVCLNTDNPLISRTDLINEFFVASSTMRNQPLTLWLALLLVKTAFRSCFLPLPQRRILIQTVDNYIENLLQDPDVVELMQGLAASG